MINVIRNRLFRVRYTYPDAADQQRAINLVIMTWISVVGWSIAFFALIVPELLFGTVPITPGFIISALEPVVFIVIFVLLNGGRLRAAIWLFIAQHTALTMAASLASQPNFLIVVLALPLVAAAVLLSARALRGVIVLIAVLLVLRLALPPDFVFATIEYENPEQVQFLVVALILLVISVYLYIFRANGERVQGVEAEDLRHLRVTAGFSSTLPENADEQRVYTHALELLQTELGYSLAQIHVVGSDDTYTRLRIGMGQTISNSRTAIRVSADSTAIGAAVRLREPVVVLSEEGQVRSAHIVPPARQGVAIPVIVNDQVRCVIDVQSRAVEALSENQVYAIELLGQQMAAVLRFRDRLQDLNYTLNEQNLVLDRVRGQLSAVEQSSRQVFTSGWETYLQGREDVAVGFDVAGTRDQFIPVPASDLPDHMREAMLRGELYIEIASDEQIIHAPVRLRGEVLGAMTFAVPGDHVLNPRQLDMVMTVADRLAIALDNRRLLEQAQARAERERRAAEISNQLLSVTDIDSLLEVAAEQFNEALGAIYTRVYVAPQTFATVAPPAAG
ncbi:MAG: GAF domain-containing protein, partial [Chloroflexi bacterium]|nr:GAF domain-containing protein [Chloroflexota bacterium]